MDGGVSFLDADALLGCYSCWWTVQCCHRAILPVQLVRVCLSYMSVEAPSFQFKEMPSTLPTDYIYILRADLTYMSVKTKPISRVVTPRCLSYVPILCFAPTYSNCLYKRHHRHPFNLLNASNPAPSLVYVRVDTRITFWNSREKRDSLFRPKILARFLRDSRVKISSDSHFSRVSQTKIS